MDFEDFRGFSILFAYIIFPEFKPAQRDHLRYRLDETDRSAPSGRPHLNKKQISFFQNLPQPGKLLNFPKTQKSKTVAGSRQIADFQGASYIPKRAQRPLI